MTAPSSQSMKFQDERVVREYPLHFLETMAQARLLESGGIQRRRTESIHTSTLIPTALPVDSLAARDVAGEPSSPAAPFVVVEMLDFRLGMIYCLRRGKKCIRERPML